MKEWMSEEVSGGMKERRKCSWVHGWMSKRTGGWMKEWAGNKGMDRYGWLNELEDRRLSGR